MTRRGSGRDGGRLLIIIVVEEKRGDDLLLLSMIMGWILDLLMIVLLHTDIDCNTTIRLNGIVTNYAGLTDLNQSCQFCFRAGSGAKTFPGPDHAD